MNDVCRRLVSRARPRGVSRARLRGGFSLMELILATAILAASGAALFGLIGQGSLFARRSQARAETLHLAQSALDEYLAVPDAIPPEGTFETHPEWAYRIRQEEIDLGVGDAVGAGIQTAVPATEGGIGGDVSGGGGGGVAAGLGNGVATTSGDRVEAAVGPAAVVSKLLRVVIEVAPADAAGGSGSADPVCTLTRWVRVAAAASGDASAGGGSSEPQGEIVSEPVTTPGSDSEGGSR